MALLPPFLNNTLRYFAKYHYPLTATELWFWQHGTQIPKKTIKHLALSTKHWQLRKQREKYSQQKWLLARQIGESLKNLPTIEAIFVTGALAMNNCPEHDDIDFMLITSPHTLWITRFFVNFFLWSQRRFPGQSSAPDKICLNLWLDSSHLSIQTHNLYTAHEILQAKVLWDRAHIYQKFLQENSWVGEYLPVAYRHLTLGPSPKLRRGKAAARVRYLLWPLNFLFFILQYLYMKPKMTSEKVTLQSAFFHPKKTI